MNSILPIPGRLTRRSLYVLSALVGLSAPLVSEPLVVEFFDIAPGEGVLHGASGVTSFGWDGPWHSNADWQGSTVSYDVVEEGLAYPGATDGYGGAMRVVNQLQDSGSGYFIGNVSANYRDLDSSYNSGVLWIGLLAKPEVHREFAGGANSAMVGFFQIVFTSKSLWTGDGRHLGVGNNGWGDYLWVVGGLMVNSQISSAFNMDHEQLVFPVLKVDFDNLEVSFWMNPDVEADDPGAPIWTTSISENLEISRFAIFDGSHRASNGNLSDFTGTLIDQIKMGTTYASVVPSNGVSAAEWHGYEIVDGWVYTGDWMGWLYVADAPWVYHPSAGWLYFEGSEPSGEWVFSPRP